VTVYAATAIASVRCRAPSGSAHPVDRQPQNNTFPAGGAPAAAPVFYLQGTADRGFRPTSSQQEQQLDQTLPFFTLRQMLTRNGLAASAATTTLVPGTTGVTEVVLQLSPEGPRQICTAL